MHHPLAPDAMGTPTEGQVVKMIGNASILIGAGAACLLFVVANRLRSHPACQPTTQPDATPRPDARPIRFDALTWAIEQVENGPVDNRLNVKSQARRDILAEAELQGILGPLTDTLRGGGG